jgi:hypothetical protein
MNNIIDELERRRLRKDIIFAKSWLLVNGVDTKKPDS